MQIVTRWRLGSGQKNLGDDFKRIQHQGEEADKPDSYTPYLTDLGLSPKSPYSTTASAFLDSYNRHMLRFNKITKLPDCGRYKLRRTVDYGNNMWLRLP